MAVVAVTERLRRHMKATGSAAQAVNQMPSIGLQPAHAVLGVGHGRATRETVKACYRCDRLRVHQDKTAARQSSGSRSGDVKPRYRSRMRASMASIYPRARDA